jgi:Na+-transporting methylmalonyl-CoA/oxaloacetate decarboxylase gamma subunit
LKLANFVLIFLFCLAITACGKSQAELKAEKYEREEQAAAREFRNNVLTPCQNANNCKSVQQMIEERKAMDLKNAK